LLLLLLMWADLRPAATAATSAAVAWALASFNWTAGEMSFYV